nr:uncharacterized protein LOC128697098 [Cherax quadricarinatus]
MADLYGESLDSDSGELASTEVDVVYLQSSPMVSHKVVPLPPPPDSESTAVSLATSFSPYKANNVSLSRTSSLRCSSASTSPKHSLVERPSGPPQTVTFKADKTLKGLVDGTEPSPIRRVSECVSGNTLKFKNHSMFCLPSGKFNPQLNSGSRITLKTHYTYSKLSYKAHLYTVSSFI